MPQEQLTDNQVLNEVLALVKEGKVAWTQHVQERMAERGYERGQIKQCLSTGYFIEKPYIPNIGGELQYKFMLEGKVDGEAINVVASLIPDKKVVVITVINPNQ